VGVDVGLVGEVDGGRESAGSLGLAELGSWANQVRRDFAGAASAVGFLTVRGEEHQRLFMV
jgi:hypothetical protein